MVEDDKKLEAFEILYDTKVPQFDDYDVVYRGAGWEAKHVSYILFGHEDLETDSSCQGWSTPENDTERSDTMGGRFYYFELVEKPKKQRLMEIEDFDWSRSMWLVAEDMTGAVPSFIETCCEDFIYTRGDAGNSRVRSVEELHESGLRYAYSPRTPWDKAQPFMIDA